MISTVDDFFNYFIEELKENEKLRDYHRIINSEKSYLFRRAYVQERFEYVVRNIKTQNARILDLGCGYGTTSILLTLLGHDVTGTTLEYYFSEINNRLEYWKKFLDNSKIDFKYENLFSSNYKKGEFDYIIVQDTLHHLEPINEAMQIFQYILKDTGSIIVSEENGSNFICNLKHFRERGFKRIVSYYDEKLEQQILFGNENTRSLAKWVRLFRRNEFLVDSKNVEYNRILPPLFFRKYGMRETLKKEKVIKKKLRFLCNYLFFGVNFIAKKRME